MRTFNSLHIQHEADTGAARRAVHRFAASHGFSESELGAIDIIVQEIATNAVCYATGGGTLHFALFEAVKSNSRIPFTTSFNINSATGYATTDRHPPDIAYDGIELIYLDKGPGIYDINRALDDGFSTGGTLGTGFGAVRRMSDYFDVYSTVNTTERRSLSNSRHTIHGTVILCRKKLSARTSNIASSKINSAHPASDDSIYGAWSRPFPGEQANGDAYFVKTQAHETLAAVVDGLGHGHGASDAAAEALRALDEWDGEPLDELIMRTHDRLRATRGAVMSVVLIDRKHERLHFAGVGNIHTRVFNASEPVHLITTNGTLGARLVKVPVWSHAWTAETIIIMASDGLSASWDITDYPRLLNHDSQLIAAVLMRDFARDTDDATVLVIR